MAHFFRRHKFARMSSEVNSEIDYKDQRQLARAIKRARYLALIGYTDLQNR